MIKETVDISGFDLKENNRKKDDAFDAIGMAICATIKTYQELWKSEGVDNSLWKNIIKSNRQVI